MFAQTTSHSSPSMWRRAINWLPTKIDRRVIVAAWATLFVQIAIVGTGGLVRLTGSGLGCPTWPTCTEDSLIATPEMGIHGVIEFGNRLLTFVLAIVAIVTFVLVIRMRRSRPELFWLALSIGLYIPLQAILGGITVLTNLNPFVVGLHFLASAVLVALAAAFVVRVYAAPGPRVRAVPTWYAALTHLTSFGVAVTVVVGVLVTGSGPHAGDGGARRNGLDPELMQHIHSWPAYVTFALTLLLFAAAFRTPAALRLRLWTSLLLITELIQVAVGLWQARAGLPIALVNIHMVLSMLLVAAMTAVVMNLKTTTARHAQLIHS